MRSFRVLFRILAVCLLLNVHHAWSQVEPLGDILRRSLQFAGRQLEATVLDMGDSTRFPRSTRPDGSWNTVHARDWTAGFFPGMLWNVGEYLGDSTLLRSAEQWTEKLDSTQFYGGSHDIGFLMFCSYGTGYRIRPTEHRRQVLLQSARTLTSRFNASVGGIRSWDRRKWPFPVIIDNMMNLELLLWASRNGGSPEMRSIAVSHAERTMAEHMRSDGSSFHVVSYDSTTGQVLEKVTHQGFADSSTWSRGQAWAIYGFTMMYQYTNDPRFLATAQRAAEYFMSHLPEDHIPYWDFQAPNIPNEPRDASAAAIAASGLIELSRASTSPSSVKYRDAAERILRALASPAYLASGSATRGIILHATGNVPSKSEIDVSLAYSDYYFIEAALKWLGRM